MPIVQYRDLGDVRYGRFGNQLSEYIFARRYAEKVRAILETPSWIGQELFVGINEQPPSREFPTLPNEYIPRGEVNINLRGFYSSPAAQATWTREYARQIYTIKPDILKANPKPKTPLIVAHLRRGDFCLMTNGFQVITKHAFEKAIVHHGFNLDEVVWVTDDKPTHYHLSDNRMFRDFLLCCWADVLFCSSLSTFTFWASILGSPRTFVGQAKLLRNQDITPRNKYVSPEFIETVFKK